METGGSSQREERYLERPRPAFGQTRAALAGSETGLELRCWTIMAGQPDRTESGGGGKRAKRRPIFSLAVVVMAIALLGWLNTYRRHDESVRRTRSRIRRIAPQLAVAFQSGALLAPDGSLWSWGDIEIPRENFGEPPSREIRRIGSATDWRSVAVGFSSAMALKTDGGLWGWGNNKSGAAGQFAAMEWVTEPNRIGLETNWIQISAGAGHGLALKSDGSLWSWGENNYGQVGNGSTNNQFGIAQIGRDHDWKLCAAGDLASYAVKRDGTLWEWGELGEQHTCILPRPIDARGDIAAISAKDHIVLVLRTNGTLWIGGENAPAAASAFVPLPTVSLARVGNEADWSEVHAGAGFFFARKRNGHWWVCGSQSRLMTRLPSPRPLALPFEPSSLAARPGEAEAMAADGSLWKLTVCRNTGLWARTAAVAGRLGNMFRGHSPSFNTNDFPLTVTSEKLWELP